MIRMKCARLTTLVQPTRVQAFQEGQIDIDETPPKVNLSYPRLRLHCERDGCASLEQVHLIFARNQYDVAAESDLLPQGGLASKDVVQSGADGVIE